MRRGEVVVALVLLVLSPSAARAERGGSGTGGRKVTVSANGNRTAAKATTSRPGGVIVFPRVTGCRTWLDATKVPARKMRSCPSINGGAPFPVADIFPAGQEVGEVRPPSPTIHTNGSWYAQRTGYLWLDAGEVGGINTAAGLWNNGASVGAATVRLTRAVFDPGFGNGGRDCTRDEILTPYDTSREHSDQDTCAYVYEVSSRANRPETADETYHARLRLFWNVTSLCFTSGNCATADELAALGELQSDSQQLNIRVEEIQSLVVCKSNSKDRCQS